VSPVTAATAWLLLALALPTDRVEVRMRALRAIEMLGAAALRDGIFLLPASAATREAFSRIAERVRRSGGSAHVFVAQTLDTAEAVELAALFDRNLRYAEIIKTVESLRTGFGLAEPAAIGQVLAKQRRALEEVLAVDFFASSLRREAQRVLTRSEKLMRRLEAETTREA
jgi:hypothetical protein